MTMPAATGKTPSTFLEVIEIAQTSESRRRIYTRILLSTFAVLLILTAAKFSGVGPGFQARPLVDFDDFHIAGQLVWRGEIEKAYFFHTMSQVQKALSGREAFLPWTYPPQFDLLVAPFAPLPIGLAYGLFTAGTLAPFLSTLRRIAANYFTPVLIVISPAMMVSIRCGQNGFLTGSLIGLTCVGLLAGRRLAGLPLGLMIIKPHLAVAFAVYILVKRNWGAVFVAAGTVAVTSALATILLGQGVWTAFFGGVKEARIFLEHGLYPLFRMVSPYAAIRAFGLPAMASAIAQALSATLALVTVILAIRWLSPRQSLGVTAIASLLVSPYAYDYDLPVAGIGLAFLLPDLIRLGTGRERIALYCLVLFTSGFGMAVTVWLELT